MATERERFDEIAAMLRDQDLEFVRRTERLAQTEFDGAAERRALGLGLVSLLFGLSAVLACVMFNQPLVGALVYLAMVFAVAPAVQVLLRRKAGRFLQRRGL
jgi:hypothetical protein